ncbi:MAG: ABC transporter substrate-binding protein [Burkholderiales bacterium]|nr:ABC transporter substrate-binding protein [Burkholderiales bacterium]
MRIAIRLIHCLLLATLVVPVGAQEPIRGGTLTMVVQPEPPGLVSAVNPAGPIGVVSTKILEGLLTYDFDMNPKPALAESWSVSADGKTITFNLRKGVKWHDGRDFTAADVQFSMMKIWKELHPRGRSTFAEVTAVDTPTPTQAVFRLATPAPYLMSALSGYESQILPKHIYDGTDIMQNPANNKPVGTGPFMFKEWQKGNFILLERNPNYWDKGKPYLDKIVLRTIPDASSRAAAFETGEVQLGGFSPVPLNDVKRLEATGKFDFETRGYEYLSPLFLMEFNLSNQYLKDKRVRQAIAHAIDTKVIVRTIWFGFGTPAISPVPSVLTQFHDPNVPKYAYDPKKAEQLLDEAGFKRGAGGKRFKLVHDFLPYGNDYQRTSEYLKQALGKVGIDVELRSQDTAAFLKRVYTDNDFEFTTNFFYALPDPSIGVQRIYWSKNIKKGVPFSNSSGYSNPEMDRIIEGALVEHDKAKRRELINRLQRTAVEDLPVLDLFEIRFFTLASKRVHNHTSSAEGIYGSFSSTWLSK